MKRKQPTRSNQSNQQPRGLEPRRLAEARGGRDLGIIVASGTPPADVMQMQHNEAFIRSSARPQLRRAS